MRAYSDYLQRKRNQYGERFDTRDLDPRFVRFYESQERIKIETCGMQLTGTVGVTTGWRPCFLLMRTRRSVGSPWTLGPKDKLLGVRKGRIYQEVK